MFFIFFIFIVILIFTRKYTKKTTLKVTHNQPQFFFQYCAGCPNGPKTKIPYHQKPLNVGMGIETGVQAKNYTVFIGVFSRSFVRISGHFRNTFGDFEAKLLSVSIYGFTSY